MRTGTALAGSLLAIVAPNGAAIPLAEILTQPGPLSADAASVAIAVAVYD